MDDWLLISIRLSDGAECLTLRNNGQEVCTYAPGRAPYQHMWHSYFKGFPKQDFSSREACIANAESIANRKLVVEEIVVTGSYEGDENGPIKYSKQTRRKE